VEWMDTEGMASDLIEESWKDETYRREHIDHIIDVIGKWTRTHSALELFKHGQLMHFPWAPVCSPHEVQESPQLRARGFFQKEESREGGGRGSSPLLPIPQKSSPSPGQHNVQIYRDELGLSDEDMKQLLFKKVI